MTDDEKRHEFIKMLTGSMTPGQLAAADQQQTRTRQIALELFSTYVMFCFSIQHHMTPTTIQMYQAMVDRVHQLTVHPEHPTDLACVVSQLCHVLFMTTFERHGADWDRFFAAEVGGELFVDKKETASNLWAAFKMGETP